MTIQQQLYREIETLPLDAQKKMLKMVHFLKVEIFAPAPRKTRARIPKSSLVDLSDMTIETGISDLAAQHDHYLYGSAKQ